MEIQHRLSVVFRTTYIRVVLYRCFFCVDDLCLLETLQRLRRVFLHLSCGRITPLPDSEPGTNRIPPWYHLINKKLTSEGQLNYTSMHPGPYAGRSCTCSRIRGINSRSSIMNGERHMEHNVSAHQTFVVRDMQAQAGHSIANERSEYCVRSGCGDEKIAMLTFTIASTRNYSSDGVQ